MEVGLGASLEAAGAASQLSLSGWPLRVSRNVRSPVWFVVNSSGIERTPQPHKAAALSPVAVRPAQSWRETRSCWSTSSQPTTVLAMP